MGKLETKKYLTLEFLFEMKIFYLCKITYITHHIVISKAYWLTIADIKSNESNVILIRLYLLWPIVRLWHSKQQVLWRVAPRGELTSVTLQNCFFIYSQQVFPSEWERNPGHMEDYRHTRALHYLCYRYIATYKIIVVIK